MQPTSIWNHARAEMMLDPSVINLNTGSFGPLPRCVFNYATSLRKRLAEEPMDFFVRQSGPLLWDARDKLAAFLGADPYRLCFMANVSCAINTVASSLTLSSPGEILLTDHEYGAMHWCWERAAQRQGLRLKTFALPVMAEDPEEIVEVACKAFSENTRLFFFSHVLSATGLVLPAKRLCEEARKRGILTCIDGAHGPGMVELKLKDLPCDFYGGNCHKWLLAPSGAGFLYTRPGNETLLHPLHVSWGWKADGDPDERNEFGSTHWLFQFEFEGTRDPCPWLAVPTAIDFQQKLGWENVRNRNEKLVQFVRWKLGEELGLKIWTPTHPEMHGFMTTFVLPKSTDADKLKNNLWGLHRIEVPINRREYGVLLRVSTHFYNISQEIENFAKVLPNHLETL